MASNNTFNHPYDQILAEAYALPNGGTPVILTNTATIDASESGTIWVRVFASNNAGTGTTVEIVNPNTLIFVPVVGTTVTEVATWTGGGHRLPGTIVSAITASANSVISWAPGVMICEFALPKTMIQALADSNTAGTARAPHLYLAVYAVVVADESADFIEAYTYVE